VIHKNSDTSSGTFTCYLTSKYSEAEIFRLLGCDVYSNGFVVPEVLREPIPAIFRIASSDNAYEILDVVITSVTFPLGKGFAGEIQVSFEGGALVQTPRGLDSFFKNNQNEHFGIRPLEFWYNDEPQQLISANINVAQSVKWVGSNSIYDLYNIRRPVFTGHKVNITTTQYHKQEDLSPDFANLVIQQGTIRVLIEQASVTKRIDTSGDIITLSYDIQPTSYMPTIQII